MQSSLLTWLKKPSSSQKHASNHLPTPPPEASFALAHLPQPEPDSANQVGSPRKESLNQEDPPEEEPSDPREESSPKDESSENPPPPPPHPFTVPLPPLPPNLTLTPCTPSLLPSLKRLNALLLPIPYPPSFYTTTLSDSTTSALTLLALWHNDSPTSPPRLVSAIRCQLLHDFDRQDASQTRPQRQTQHEAESTQIRDQKSGRGKPTLYIATLATLSPYRCHGLGTHLLATVTARAIADFGIEAVGAHVWVRNTEAREWYRRRGFVEVGVRRGYYRRLAGVAGGGGGKRSGSGGVGGAKGGEAEGGGEEEGDGDGDGDAVVVRRVVGVGDLLGRV